MAVGEQTTSASCGLPETRLLCSSPNTTHNAISLQAFFHSLESRNPVGTWSCFLNFLISQSFSKGKYKTRMLPKSQVAQGQFLIRCIDRAKALVPRLTQSLLRVSASEASSSVAPRRSRGLRLVPGSHSLLWENEMSHKSQEHITESSQEPVLNRARQQTFTEHSWLPRSPIYRHPVLAKH